MTHVRVAGAIGASLLIVGAEAGCNSIIGIPDPWVDASSTQDAESGDATTGDGQGSASGSSGASSGTASSGSSGASSGSAASSSGGSSSGSSGSATSSGSSSSSGSSGSSASSSSSSGGTVPLSCKGRPAGADLSCGVTGGDAGTSVSNDCCSSLEVSATATATSFYRGFNGYTAGGTNMTSPASLSAFRLDEYEVTVGRFRQFVNAVVGGWHPTDGQGKHSHLNGGAGVAAVGTDALSNETGWVTASYPSLPTTTGGSTGWDSNLSASSCSGSTWVDTAGSGTENLPINCITWYEAYAFCIWDGGFLPSEAEWNYAAAGPYQSSPTPSQRVYPWPNSSGPSGSVVPNNIDCTFANYRPPAAACAPGPTAAGTYSPRGDGMWGQSDLAGNVAEWTLDATAGVASTFIDPCTDCANLNGTFSGRIARGGNYNIATAGVTTSYRLSFSAATRDGTLGVRCARVP